ncbi:ATP-dependent DNA helicase pif1-like [Corticium candelabrum]|uniref:ATP-dependent DNA helicase pif1-like n=1 Tax=Corticium candelabrum TaxID=121492 RepID=UPI002E259BB0|nr:ATP-dependent DNA helicase pif1-like [Corticium candelabrum]
MSDDILHQCRREARQPDMDYSDDMYNECLFRLQELVQQMSGQKLEEYGLPPVNRGHEDRLTVDLLREKSYDREALQQFVDENETNLTIDQRNIDLRITDMVHHGQGGIIFIDAPGGTGKTYLINLSLARLRSRGFVALAVASSGIAAQLLSNGKTAHSTFKIPLNLMTTDLPMCNLKRGSSKATLLQECTVIFWDEATMANKLAFEALDCTLQDLRQSSRPFGGILVVLSGDFRQTLPVIRGGTRANEIDACIKSSHLWQHVETHSLTTNMRAYLYGDANAAEFASLLLRVGNGHIPVVEGRHTIFIPEDLGTVTDSPQTLIERVYPNLQHHYQDFEWLMQRAILAPHNVSIRDINWEMLQLFPGEIKIYKSIDTVRDDDAVHYPSWYASS